MVELDGQPLAVLAVLEELLADLAAWEESDATDPPHHRAPLRLPAPLAGGVALAAVRRLAAALGPTQWLGWERGRLRAFDGSHTPPPLSVLTLPSADIALLSPPASALGRPGLEPDLVDVLTAYADRLTDQLAGRHTPADRARFVARIAALAGLLDLAPTAATQLLVARLAASPPGLDLALTDTDSGVLLACRSRPVTCGRTRWICVSGWWPRSMRG